MLVNANGEEIERIIGYDSKPEKFIAMLQDFVAGKNTIQDLLAQYRQSPNDVDVNYAVAKRYIARDDAFKAYDYLTNILNLDPDDTKGHGEEAKCYLGMYELWKKDNSSPLQTLLPSLRDANIIRLGFNSLIRYYRNKKDTLQVVQTYENMLERIPSDASSLNDYAWYIYQQRIEEKYQSGIDATKKALELRPDAANIWDTLAWLLYEKGDKNEAVTAMEKAVSLAGRNKEDYQANLARMKKQLLNAR